MLGGFQRVCFLFKGSPRVAIDGCDEEAMEVGFVPRTRWRIRVTVPRINPGKVKIERDG